MFQHRVMAWRIAESVERGEIDNRTKGRVVGKLWLCGRAEPVRIELTGNPWRDLAGQYLRFVNPEAKPLPEHYANFADEQTGVVGDMTAARKVKVLDFPIEELKNYYKTGIPMPYHWGNSLYLEWHSVRNGRVVIEATNYELKVEPEAAWQMSEEDEQAQQEANGRAMVNFMDQLVEAAAVVETVDEADDDAPQSAAEAEADQEAARMDMLLDRVTARMDHEGFDESQFEQIMEEERERLRRERGEPEPEPLSPQEVADCNEWIAAANEAAEESTADGYEELHNREHPLVTHCHELGRRLRKEIKQNEWLDDTVHTEHPLHELVHSIWLAGAKLAGALNGDPQDWPPDALFAGDTLVRLKKARGYFQDTLRALESVDADKLADPAWSPPIRQEVEGLLCTVQELIDEIRAVLQDGQPDA